MSHRTLVLFSYEIEICEHLELIGYDEVNRMLYGMIEKPDRFILDANKRI